MTSTLPSAADCERIFHAALNAGDAQGVAAALQLMVVQDPHRAQVLLETVQLGLDLARGDA